MQTTMVKEIPVQDAIGRVLSHDITRIVPGEFHGRAFKKGHLIGPEDVPKLLNLGKDNIYVLDLAEGYIHENDAALRIARAAMGRGLTLSEPAEGKVRLTTLNSGLLKINVSALNRINSIDQIVFATRHGNRTVARGWDVAGTRIVPLYTEEAKIRRIEAICAESGPVVDVAPFRSLKVGLVTTGNEVYHRRIEDKFGPVVRAKFAELGSEILDQELTSDSVEMTSGAIRRFIEAGAEMVVVTGGMSVDPDDRTPASIRAAGAEVVTYGSPTFPGAMFLLATIGEVPVIGVPGCAMYHKATIFDLIVPRLLAGETVTRADIVALGHGGFCLSCEECRYPDCGFGV